jgi:hypothetical protein
MAAQNETVSVTKTVVTGVVVLLVALIFATVSYRVTATQVNGSVAQAAVSHNLCQQEAHRAGDAPLWVACTK